MTALGLSAGSILPAQAIIVDGKITGGSVMNNSGHFLELGGASEFVVGNDNFDTPNLYAFNEDQNIVINKPLSFDIGPGNNPLPVGTEVASHYIFFDPKNLETIQASIEFDSPVLAIMTSTDNLDNSDFLANNNITYLNPNLRGLENVDDKVTIDSSNPNVIHIDFQARRPGDYIRVLTASSAGAESCAEIKDSPILSLTGETISPTVEIDELGQN